MVTNWCIYVGNAATENLKIGRSVRTWGVDELKNIKGLAVGDTVLFVFDITSRYTPPPRGYPRVRTAKDFEGSATSVIHARVTLAPHRSESQLWPDKLYPYRFEFEETAEERDVSFQTPTFDAATIDATRMSLLARGAARRVQDASGMQSCLYNTSSTWATFLQEQGVVDNVNFWRKDKRILRLAAGAAFYFKALGAQQVVGRGYFRENVNISVEEAWARFGTGNGWPTNETFFQGINAFTNNEVSRDTEINCIVLDGIEWLASPIALPVNFFPKGILGAKYYEDREVAFLASAFSSNALSGETATPLASDCDDAPPGPGRADQTVSRILRDTKLARRVKALHRYRCQICNEILTLANGDLYAEAHHLQPLGGDHHGPA